MTGGDPPIVDDGGSPIGADTSAHASGRTPGERFAPWLCLLVAFAVYAVAADHRAFWRTDEFRYAEVARQMVRSGDWVVPQLNGEVYTHKPPGFFWLVAAGHSVLGLSIERAAKLPSVAAAAAMLAMVFVLGRRLHGSRAGTLAALCLGSSGLFLSLALRGNLDALLAGFTTGALTLYFTASGPPGESGAPRPERMRLLLGAGVCAGFAILVKGPVGFAIPAAVILTHRAWTRGVAALADRRLVWMLLAALLPVLCWLGLAFVRGGAGYVDDLVWGHGVGHAIGRVDKLRPFWFYLKTFPSGFAPWSILLPLAFVVARTHRERQVALVWTVAPLVLLSLFPAKRHLYLLPMYPGAALLVAGILAPGLRWERSATWTVSRIVLGGAAFVVAATIQAALLGWIQMPLSLPLPTSAGAMAAAAGTALLLAGAGGALCGRGATAPTLSRLAPFAVAVAIALLGFVHPLEARVEDPAPFYRDVHREVGDAPLYAYGSVDFFANLLLEKDRIEVLHDVDQATSLLADCTGRVYLIARGRVLDRLGHPEGWEPILSVQGDSETRRLLLRGACSGAAFRAPRT